MIVNDKLGNVEAHNLGETNTFKIKTSAKAFKILSSQLYSNKIGAIIRELGTNAADAHVEAKNNEPFHVKLPNRLDPTFKIRDFGTGISPEDIVHVYTTYFESSKTNSNEFTGCLGLGSKSPFCYVDSFTIGDYWNGQKYSYIAFINENGVPCLTKVGQIDTKEPNGLEIEFPVVSSNIGDFEREAKKIYSHFRTRPKVTGSSNFKFDEYEVVLSKDNWKAYKANYSYGSRSVIIRMGNVAYETNFNHNRSSYLHLLFDVKIGDVDITASREDLEYTNKTNEHIKNLLKQFEKDFRDEVEKHVQKLPSYYDACIYFTDNSNWIHNIVLKYKGKELKTSIQVPAAVACEHKFFSRNRVQKSWTNSVIYSKNNVFIEDDLQKGGKLRINAYVRENPGHHITSLKFPPELKSADFYQEWEIPKEQIKLTSEIKLPKREKGLGRGSPSQYVYEVGDNCIFYKIDANEMKEDSYYITSERFSPVDISSGEISAIKSLKNNITVYAIPQHLLDKIDLDDYTPLKELIDDVKKEYKNDGSLIVNMSDYIRFNHFKKLEGLVSDKNLLKFIEDIKRVEQHKKCYGFVKTLMPSISEPEEENSDIFDKYNIKKYPLLQEMMGWYTFNINDSNKQCIADYIKMVNKLEKN